MTHHQQIQPREVIFSERAHAAIVAETLEHHPDETGGILLGHCSAGAWHVIEAIDPGPASRFSPVSFEYDTPYVNHLARKVARHYRRPLTLIGLWHRHPGSMDHFSGTDDITNRRYAEQSPHGALSCLVNLDPIFRITAYHVPANLAYRPLPHRCNDLAIPAALRELRRSSCLSPAVLDSSHLQQRLAALLAGCPAGEPGEALRETLALQLEPVLEVLDGQPRVAYALQPHGVGLCLALADRRGPQQHLLHLRVNGNGELLLEQAGVQQPFHPARLQNVLEQMVHG